MTVDREPRKVWLVLLFLTAGAIRFAGIGVKQLWVDEIIQVIHSRPDSIGAILNGVAQDRGGAPLDYIIQHYTMKAAGAVFPLEIAARFHAFLFGSVTVVLVYFLSIRLLNNGRIALLAAALYAFFPFHHHYSQEGRPYALFVLLVLILFIMFLRAQKDCSWTALLMMVGCAAMAYYTQPFTALFFIALISANLIRLNAGKMRIGLGFFAPWISGIAGACLFIPWVIYSIEKTKGDFVHAISLRLISEAIQGLGDGSYPVSIMLLSLAVLGVVYLKRAGPDALAPLCCWILIPVPLILGILYWRSYFFSTRQLIFITPAIVILAACGIEHLLVRYGKKALAVPAIYIGISLVVIGLHYPDKRVDFRSAGAYLKQAVAAEDRILAPNSLGLLSFYFPGIYDHGNVDPEYGFGCSRLIFVDTEYANAAEKELIKLQSKMALQKKIDYRGISILIFVNRGFPRIKSV